MSKINKEYLINDLLKKIRLLKEKDLIIGFTNGCFDLLHKGHIKLLAAAKEKCDYLIVGLNADSSIKMLKGDTRPIDNQLIRIFNLSLRPEVDAVILFYTKTPLELIKELSPNIMFKGADYSKNEIVGKDYILRNGGKVELVDILDGYSTTNIINNSSI